MAACLAAMSSECFGFAPYSFMPAQREGVMLVQGKGRAGFIGSASLPMQRSVRAMKRGLVGEKMGCKFVLHERCHTRADWLCIAVLCEIENRMHAFTTVHDPRNATLFRLSFKLKDPFYLVITHVNMIPRPTRSASTRHMPYTETARDPGMICRTRVESSSFPSLFSDDSLLSYHVGHLYLTSPALCFLPLPLI